MELTLALEGTRVHKLYSNLKVRFEGSTINRAEATLTEAEGRRKRGGGAAKHGVRESVGRLGVSVRGRNGSFAGDFSEAESKKNEEREGSSSGTGERR